MENNSFIIKAKIQKMGGFLSSMVMPNIGAFIAWGLITAIFIPTGWRPNEEFAKLVGPTITYLLPILIGYTGGYNVYGKRGGVAGALATMGVVIGSDIVMLIGGMIMGPLGALVIKKIDSKIDNKIKPGMEMLINNFTIGISSAIVMILGFAVIQPLFNVILSFLSSGVQFLSDRNLIPFTSIFVQPAQILFLNNAINHGIMGPMGIQQVADTGKSILFLVEANGGTWFGLLLAFCVFGKGIAKKSAPAAAGIMFFGGIGEVAFPYALMKPVTVLGPMIGNIAALFILQIFNGGTVGAVSPGSFLALLMMTPKGSFIVNITAYVVATAVSFLVVGFFLLRDKSVEQNEVYIGSETKISSIKDESVLNVSKPIEKIVFACDAGMGSSVMGESILKTKLEKAMLNIEVGHASISTIPDDADVIVTNKSLEDRILKFIGNKNIPVFTINNFLDANEYDNIVKNLKSSVK